MHGVENCHSQRVEVRELEESKPSDPALFKFLLLLLRW